ncbi:helix-turn-helix domain-containing protein [Elizabethkingia ursingii]|uniref:helix-turn-helix domain-containing protein n=1 Tax=Elizabethkingia ursingii TaxID=1756150 RepID=UPI000AC35001|nr:helix-turn-helix domain-containing protein [Elizabethkingia ursingii]
MKNVLIFVCLLMVILCKSYVRELSENEIIQKYDQISISKSESKVSDINKLYQYSLNKNYKSGILKGLIALQRYYLAKSNYTLALNYGEKALESARKLNNNNALSDICMYKGTTLAMLDMHIESKKALNISIEYAKKINNVVDQNIQLSRIYTTFSGLSEGEDLNNSILYYSQKSLDIIESISNQNLTKTQESRYYSMLIDQYLNMGSVYSHFVQPPNLKKAEYYYSKALSLSRSHPEYFEQSALFAYFTIGHFYFQQKDYQKSIKYFERFLEEEKKDKDPNRRLAVYDNLKNVYDSIKDVSQQNKYLKLYSKLNDSLLRVKNKSVVSQSDKQSYYLEREAYSLKKYLLLSTIIAIVLLIGISIFFRKRNQELRKKYIVLIDKLEKDNDKGVDYKSLERNKISSEKEKILIAKLSDFETSEKFLKKSLTLSYLSHILNTNPNYLSHIINLHKEQNFNAYINQLRINYISHKLFNHPKYREYKISYLAEECGYASPQVFINAFKKETGMTPSYFIANLKQGDASDK